MNKMIKKMKCNLAMKQMLKDVSQNKDVSIYKTDLKYLYKILSSDIIFYEECYLLKGNIILRGLKKRNDFNDKIGVELFENHIHVRDIILNKIIKPIDMLTMGLILVQALYEKLNNSYKTIPFIITISCALDGTNIFGKKKSGDCIVRFYKHREENPSGIADDLESYKSEAVGVLTLNC